MYPFSIPRLKPGVYPRAIAKLHHYHFFVIEWNGTIQTIQIDGNASSIVSMVFSGRSICVVPMFVGALLLLSAAHMQGQQSTQDSTQQTPPAKGAGAAVAPTQKSPPVSNPFPMAQSQAAAKADEQKSQDNGKPSPAQANPFPEAQSKAAAKGDGQGNSGNPKAGSSSSTGSSSGGYSSSDAHLPSPDVGQGKLGSHEKLDSFTRDQTLEGRVQDDLNVADLYINNGNYRGASLRYQDVLQFDPQNDTALYGLAEAMCKENLTSEAMAHFKSYTTDNPKGKYAKQAAKRLAHPEKCKHNH